MRAFDLIKTAGAEYGYDEQDNEGLSPVAKAAIAAGLLTAGGAGLKYGGPKLADHMMDKVNKLGDESEKIKAMLKKKKDDKPLYENASKAKEALNKKWQKLKEIGEHKHGGKALIGGGVTTAALAGTDYYQRNRG